MSFCIPIQVTCWKCDATATVMAEPVVDGGTDRMTLTLSGAIWDFTPDHWDWDTWDDTGEYRFTCLACQVGGKP